MCRSQARENQVGFCPTNIREFFIVVWFTAALGVLIIKLAVKLHAENNCI